MNNDPAMNVSESLHRGETLEENLKHLRERLRYLTVVDRDHQIVGVVSDLVITPDHCLKLVIAEATPAERTIVLDSKHILKASAREQVVYLDVLQTELGNLVEVVADHPVEQIWPQPSDTSSEVSPLEASSLEASPFNSSDTVLPPSEEATPVYASLTEIATEHEYPSPQPSPEVFASSDLVEQGAAQEWQEAPVASFQAEEYEVRAWQSIAPTTFATDAEESNLLALSEAEASSMAFNPNTQDAETVDDTSTITRHPVPDLDLSDLFTELPPAPVPAIEPMNLPTPPDPVAANAMDLTEVGIWHEDVFSPPAEAETLTDLTHDFSQPGEPATHEEPELTDALQQAEPIVPDRDDALFETQGAESFAHNLDLDATHLFIDQQEALEGDPMAGWDAVSEVDNAALEEGEEEEIAPFISEAELLELFPPERLAETGGEPAEMPPAPLPESAPESAQATPVITLPLHEEELLVNYMRRKVGEVVIRKRIDTRMVQVPLRYETLIVEQISPEQKSLVEVDLSGGELSGVEITSVSQGPAVVQGTFTDPTAASHLLQAIANTGEHGCKTIRIQIELADPELQTRYQDWIDQT